MFKSFIVVLILLFGFLQFRLWTGEGSVKDFFRIQKIIKADSLEIARLTERNKRLDVDVQALKANATAFEERARFELGMIKEGETFCLVVEH